MVISRASAIAEAGMPAASIFRIVSACPSALPSAHLWSTYIDYNRENDYVPADYDYVIFFMRPGYVSLLYSILQRNRDNNGNGYIDPDEIRWYQAAVEQVFGLYLGMPAPTVGNIGNADENNPEPLVNYQRRQALISLWAFS